MQRYDINSCSEDCDPVTLMKDGEYVLYADHLADLEAAVKEKEEQLRLIAEVVNQQKETIIKLGDSFLAQKEQIAGMRENKLYLENDLALKMEQIAALTVRAENIEAGRDSWFDAAHTYMRERDELLKGNAALTTERDNLKENREIWEERNVQLETKCCDLTAENQRLRQIVIDCHDGWPDEEGGNMIEIRRFQGIDWISLKVYLADKEAAVKERDEWHIQQFRCREAQRDKEETVLRERIAALETQQEEERKP